MIPTTAANAAKTRASSAQNLMINCPKFQMFGTAKYVHHIKLSHRYLFLVREVLFFRESKIRTVTKPKVTRDSKWDSNFS